MTTFITATYRVRAARAEVPGIAQSIALEQSVEVPLAAVHDRHVADNIVARVIDIRENADATHDIDVALAVATIGDDIAQLVNMLFGNTSMHPHVELVDAVFPDEVLALFAGPRFGTQGLRHALRVPQRALTCAALKPQGMPVEALASLCYTLAAAGIDVIKDDHGLANQAYSPFAQRVSACQGAIERAARDTGRRAAYAPSIVGSPRACAQRIRLARDEGVAALLLAPALLGLPAFAELVRDDIEVPVLAHPSLTGAARIAPPFLFGTLFRLLGADAVIFPHFAGRFAYSRSTCAQVVHRAQMPLGAFAATLPVPAGGLQLEAIDTALDFYGSDVMLLIGGSLLLEADKVHERAARFVAEVANATRTSDDMRTSNV